MNGIWDSGEHFEFNETDAPFAWVLTGYLREAVLKDEAVEWVLMFHREGLSGQSTLAYGVNVAISSGDLPAQRLRTHDSPEEARDACVAFVVRERLSGRLKR